MTQIITHRKVVPHDIPAIYSLQTEMYHIKRSKEFWNWQCFETVVPTVLMCSFCGDELVGTFGIQKRILTRNIVCGQINHLNIAPKWRRMGYFTMLGDLAMACFDDLDVLAVFANKEARIACERAFGFKTIGALDILVLSKFTNIVNNDTKCKPVTNETVFKTIHCDDIGTTMFQDSHLYRFWRYALNPIYSYSVVEIDTGEFVIVKLFCDPVTKVKSGDIVDVECPINNYDKLKKLIIGASWHLKNMGADRVTTWAVPETVFRRAVSEIGFDKGSYTSFFCIKVLKNECHDLYDFSKWHLRLADATNY